MMAEELVFDDSHEELVFDDRVEVLNVKPLDIDFVLSHSEVDDETDLTLTAFGDDADNYVWFDAEEDKVIGRGNPLTLKYTAGVGLRSIKLRASSDISKLFGVVAKENCLTVTIKEVDDFMTRVDAEIAVSGGAYTDVIVDGLQSYVHKWKHIIPNGWQMFRHGTFFPVMPVSNEVASLSFWPQNYPITDRPAKLRFFNGAGLVGNIIKTNGIDSYFIIDCRFGDLSLLGRGVGLTYAGEDSIGSALTYHAGYQINGTNRMLHGFFPNLSPPSYRVAYGIRVLDVPYGQANLNGVMVGVMNYSNDVTQSWIELASRSYAAIRWHGGQHIKSEPLADASSDTLFQGSTFIPFGGWGRIDNPDTQTPAYYTQSNWGTLHFLDIELLPEWEEYVMDAFLQLQQSFGR